MPRPAKVDHARDSFLLAIARANGLVDEIEQYGIVRSWPGHPGVHMEYVRRIVELAFLGVGAAWEEFLEETFVRYMAGAVCDSGYAPSLRLGECEGLDHAYRVLSGDPSYDPAKHFLLWTDPEAVVKLAEVFFDQGAPYAHPLTVFKDELVRAGDIRNRVAHLSQRAKNKYRQTALYFLRSSSLSQGFSPGKLLRVSPAQGFAPLSPTWGGTIPTLFTAYMEMYSALAGEVVPV